MTVKEYYEGQLELHEKEVAELTSFLEELPDELGALEADSIYDLGSHWLVLTDSSHEDLGAKLATLSGQSVRFESRTHQVVAQFRDVGPFWWIDLRRPKKGCRTVRVRKPAQELTITVCGKIPDSYEYIGEAEG